MACFKKLSLNNLYLLKRLDFFAFEVKMRLQRSKEGGRSDARIGSWFGVFLSLMIVFGLIQYFSQKITSMNEYLNVSYTSIEFKNKFGNLMDERSLEAGDILIDKYTFLPSIDSKLITTEDLSSIQSKNYAEIFKFNEDFTDYQFNIEKLKKYVKFYVKILKKGSLLEKQTILRSDMVQCTQEMFEKLGGSLISKFKTEKRLCPDMKNINEYLRVKNAYTN